MLGVLVLGAGGGEASKMGIGIEAGMGVEVRRLKHVASRPNFIPIYRCFFIACIENTYCGYIYIYIWVSEQWR